jgi:pyruvate dehydrogenase E2 component (dihydrolipoamide acetyltransferase)
MAIQLPMPPLGEGVESAEVLEVKVSPGETVRAGQILVVVQAEKATAELEAPEPGRVAKILVKPGDTLKVGEPFCEFEPAGAGERQAEPEKPAAKPKPTESTKPQSQLKPDGPPRTPPEKPAPQPARVAGDGVHAGTKPQAAVERAKPQGAVVPAGPATRLLARKLGVDLHQVTGSGKGGRISQEDVEAYVRQLTTGAAPALVPVATGVQAPALPDFSRWGEVERQSLDPIRRRTAQQMHLAWTTIPHVTQHDVADITDLDAFRKQQEGPGPKLTVTAFALKAAAIALRQFPYFNASLDMAGGALVLKRYYHLGVAVDTEHGLLVPVIRDVDKKSVLQLAGELTDVAERARQRKLQAEEMRGGTFTITNLGGIGGTGFTPIINWPEVAILGMSRARWEGTVRDGQVTPRLLLPLSLSYDHRVIDGAAAARFTRRIAELLGSGWNMALCG